MVDALVPFSATLTREVDAGASLTRCVGVSPPTRPPRPPRPPPTSCPAWAVPGPHAEKSLGTPDPGAHSLALIVRAVADVLAERAGLATKGTNA